MRRFEDDSGRPWTVSVGRESWGTQLLLFSPASGGPEVRKVTLAAESALDAMRELETLSDGELRQKLRQAEPWS